MTTYFNIFHFVILHWVALFYVHVSSIWTYCTNCKLHFSPEQCILLCCTFANLYVKMLAAIVCFTLLKRMVLKALVRPSSFRLINLFYNISFIFCSIFLRDLGKHVFLRLDKTVYQLIFFCYFGSAIAFLLYSWYSSLWLILQRFTLLVNSIFFRYLRKTLLMILNNAFYSITL